MQLEGTELILVLPRIEAWVLIIYFFPVEIIIRLLPYRVGWIQRNTIFVLRPNQQLVSGTMMLLMETILVLCGYG